MNIRIPIYPRLEEDRYTDSGNIRRLYRGPFGSGLPSNIPDSFISGALVNLAVHQLFSDGKKQAYSAATRTMKSLAIAIRDLSREYCPVDTGRLRRSARIITTGQGRTREFQVRYTAPYSLWVHENLENYHEPPTQAKFLERASDEVIGNFRTRGAGFQMTVQTSFGGPVNQFTEEFVDLGGNAA